MLSYFGMLRIYFGSLILLSSEICECDKNRLFRNVSDYSRGKLEYSCTFWNVVKFVFV